MNIVHNVCIIKCVYIYTLCSMQCIYYTIVLGLDTFESKLKTSLEKENIQHLYLLLSCMERELLTGIKNGKMCNMVSSVGRLLTGRGWEYVICFKIENVVPRTTTPKHFQHISSIWVRD